jgi:hypothetical protein
MGYVVSRYGTFGVEHRSYTNESGVRMVVIRWGPMGWLTPVLESEVHRLRCSFESEARAEAEAWFLKPS